jgi:hypothetical protein
MEVLSRDTLSVRIWRCQRRQIGIVLDWSMEAKVVVGVVAV